MRRSFLEMRCSHLATFLLKINKCFLLSSENEILGHTHHEMWIKKKEKREKRSRKREGEERNSKTRVRGKKKKKLEELPRAEEGWRLH